MNYQKIIDQIVERGRLRGLPRRKRSNNFYDRHHIIPRSFGGNNDEQNCSRKCAWSCNSFPNEASEKFSSGKRIQLSRKGLTNTRKYMQNRCKLCKEFGHNKLTCRNQFSC